MKPTTSRRHTTGNLFLDLVIADDDEILKHLNTRVCRSKGQELVRSASTVAHMYFPVDVLISLSCDLENGYTAEFRQIGREGFVGFSALMGSRAAQNTAVVQTDGSAYRIRTQTIQDIFDSSPRFRRITLQYMQALMQEAAQSVVCNRFHSVNQQYSRSLLVAADRLGSRTVCLTHEQLAVAIGCRREAVSLAAGKLQQAGLIHYAYGKIEIMDMTALKARSCECYESVKSAFSMLYPTDVPESPGSNSKGA